jgi:hypothetical protein
VIPTEGFGSSRRFAPPIALTVKRMALLALIAVAAAALASTAGASEIISTSSVAGLTLQLNDKGEALLTYRSGGKLVHVLAWGAVNAAPTAPGAKPTAFQLDYSGGYAKYFLDDSAAQALARQYHKIKGTPGYLTNPVIKKLKAAQSYADNYWKTFHGGCEPYNGPTLAWVVAECKAPDGSYWAVQEWQRKLPDYGLNGTARDDAWEVHLSHWTGALPVLTVYTDWSWHKWNHLYGTFTYDGKPVFGLSSTSSGQPLDSFGRNVYLDTFDSAYGTGWKRENSFLTHKGDGVFCYSINPHPGHPAGTGTQYRATIMGPGVTPDVMWEGLAPSDSSKNDERNLAISGLHDPLCKAAS